MAQHNNETEFRRYLGEKKDIRLHDVMIIDDVAHRIHQVTVHEFNVSEEDPDLYAGVPLMGWKNSDVGQWVIKRSIQTPVFHRYLCHSTYNYQYAIVAWLKDTDYTFYQLKWGQKV